MSSNRKVSWIFGAILFPVLAVLAFFVYQRSSDLSEELKAVAESGKTAELCELNGSTVSNGCFELDIDTVKTYIGGGRMALPPSKAEIADQYMLSIYDQKHNESCYRVIRYANDSLPLLINEIDSSDGCAHVDSYKSSYYRVTNFLDESN